MNAQSRNPEFFFELPSMSYIDAKWEEPELLARPASRRARGLGGFTRLVAGFNAWRERRQVEAELAGMTDRELMDIGLSRGDIGRVYAEGANDDLRARGF